jgi:hypothetical protein
MAKAPKTEAIQPENETATAAPRRDAQNRLIDADGLPISGPARAAALASRPTAQDDAAELAANGKKEDDA